MVTVHRVIAVDNTEELRELDERKDDYMDAAGDYAARLEQYDSLVEDLKDGHGTGSLDTVVERLSAAHEQLHEERDELGDFIQGSSIRGHASYPHLDEEAVRNFRREYGVAPGEMQVEDPQDFYFTVARMCRDHGSVEWRVEQKPAESLEQLSRLVEQVSDSVAFRLQLEYDHLPDTGIDGVTVKADFFRPLVDAHQESGRQATYETVAPHERYVTENHGVSALQELWDMDVNDEVLDQIDAGSEFQRATGL